MTSFAPRALTLALFEPDIPQNAGTMLRMCACLGVDAAIIGPAGFATGDRHLRCQQMDPQQERGVERCPVGSGGQ